MLAGTERDDGAPARPWPFAAVVAFAWAVAAAIGIGFVHNRQGSVLGLRGSPLYLLGAALVALAWGIGFVASRVARRNRA